MTPTIKLQDLLKNPKIIGDVRIKAQAVEQLTQIEDNEKYDLAKKLADRLNLSLERLAAIAALGQQDRYRALTVTGQPSMRRFESEKMYPTTGWLGEYIKWAQHSSAPLAWHYWSAVALVTAACRRNVYYDAGSFYVYPANYFLLVGKSGSGKNIAINASMQIADAANIVLTKKSREMDPSEDRRIFIPPDTMTPEHWLTLLSQRTTTIDAELVKTTDARSGEVVEVFDNMVAPDSACFIVNEELMTLLGKDAFSSDRWMGYLLKMYDSPALFRDGKEVRKRPVPDVAITCLFASAPDLLARQVSDILASGGFMGRTIISYRGQNMRSYSRQVPLDPIGRDHLAAMLCDIAMLPKNSLMLMTPEATEWYTEWYEQNALAMNAANEHMAGWYSRLRSHLIKVAMIHAISDGLRMDIEAHDLATACTILNAEEPGLNHVTKELTVTDMVQRTDAVYALIMELGQATNATILQTLGRQMGTRQNMELCLEMLMSQDRIKHIKIKNGSNYWTPTYKVEQRPA